MLLMLTAVVLFVAEIVTIEPPVTLGADWSTLSVVTFEVPRGVTRATHVFVTSVRAVLFTITVLRTCYAVAIFAPELVSRAG